MELFKEMQNYYKYRINCHESINPSTEHPGGHILPVAHPHAHLLYQIAIQAKSVE